jgi:hypothetical protein
MIHQYYDDARSIVKGDWKEECDIQSKEDQERRWIKGELVENPSEGEKI